VNDHVNKNATKCMYALVKILVSELA